MDLEEANGVFESALRPDMHSRKGRSGLSATSFHFRFAKSALGITLEEGMQVLSTRRVP